MTHIPQGYPLWCAQYEPDDDSKILYGRVVAWVPRDSDDVAQHLIPVLAFVDGDTTVRYVGPVSPENIWFLGDTAEQVVAAANAWLESHINHR